MNRKFVEVAAGSGLVMAVLAGCVKPAATESAPPVPHRNSVQQLANVLGDNALNGMPLHEAVTVKTAKSRVEIYNFTLSTLSALSVRKAVRHYDQLLAKRQPATVTLLTDPTSLSETYKAPIQISPQDVKEHDLVLAPGGTPYPVVQESNVAAVNTPFSATTWIYKNHAQSVSFITEPLTKDLGKGSDVATELCQSLVAVKPQIKLSELDTKLAQEAECNGEGDAIEAAQQGKSYPAYANDDGYHLGTVNYGGPDYYVLPTTVSAPEYRAIQSLFAHS